MRLKSIRNSLVSVLKNIPGKSVGKKIVVIEADDWGSIRMPSKETFGKLLQGGIPVDQSRYGRNDTLETAEDLDSLFTVLRKHKDRNGKSAVISPFCNTANPDFEKIRVNNFERYYPQRFTDTYSRYSRGNDMTKLWHQGISDGLFAPQYHGREHLATDLWMKYLHTGDQKMRLAFDLEYASYSPPQVPKIAKDFRPNFFIDSHESIEPLHTSLEMGIDIFMETLGISPTVFNAPNGVFVPELNASLLTKGIHFNAVPRRRLDRQSNGQYVPTTFITGQKSEEGLMYYVRNCNFEPTEKGYQGTGHVLSQIQSAFICGKAAIIGTHRVNFAGGLNESNRKQGLAELNSLLAAVTSRWPEVEFMSSAEFCKLLI